MSDQRPSLDFSLILASSVHDMKNSVGMLLNSLEGFIDATDPLSEAQAKQMAVLQYEASRISGDLIQLLSIYRLQSGRLPLQIEEHFVDDLLADQLARNQMLFSTRGIETTVDCDPDLFWYFDEELVGGVLHNVLVNCARYTRSRIHLAAAIEEDHLCLTIADDGSGYPPAMLDEPLAIEQGQRRDPQSTHLGLYFAAEVAALHRQGDRRGQIQLANGGTLGGGQFRLLLP